MNEKGRERKERIEKGKEKGGVEWRERERGHKEERGKKERKKKAEKNICINEYKEKERVNINE